MRNFGKFISKHFFIYLSVVILIVLGEHDFCSQIQRSGTNIT